VPLWTRRVALRWLDPLTLLEGAAIAHREDPVMDKLFGLNLHDMFVPSASLLEMIMRGTILYLGLFIMLRMVLKRQSQGVSITDILLIVLIADASQNGMADEYRSVSEGLVLVATLVFWNYTLDWLAFRFPWFEKLVQAQPLVLVQDGKILRRNMRQELITVEELMTSLRHEGIEKVHDVERAFMEPDGTISVIKRDG
jgi:uncharacterized membrane protein YcaP (DUF421 family)